MNSNIALKITDRFRLGMNRMMGQLSNRKWCGLLGRYIFGTKEVELPFLTDVARSLPPRFHRPANAPGAWRDFSPQ